MRHPRILFVLLAFITVLSSCKTNNDVVSNGILQKRKHLSGFHWNGGKSKVNHVAQVKRGDNMEKMSAQTEALTLRFPATETKVSPATERTSPLLLASTSNTSGKADQVIFENLETKAIEPVQLARSDWNDPDTWEKADWKKKSAVKRRSGWALFLSIMGSVLFAFLAANFFVGILTSGVLLLTLTQLALLLGGLLLAWKHKDTNGASNAALILSWIFLGLTALFYFGLIVLGLLM